MAPYEVHQGYGILSCRRYLVRTWSHCVSTVTGSSIIILKERIWRKPRISLHIIRMKLRRTSSTWGSYRPRKYIFLESVTTSPSAEEIRKGSSRTALSGILFRRRDERFRTSKESGNTLTLGPRALYNQLT